MVSLQDLQACWRAVAEKGPLVYHLTNAVASPLQAAGAVAIGASPVMSLCPQEAGELARCAGGLLINCGTPTAQGMEAIEAALEARPQGMPVLLDPVGYGGTAHRRQWIDSLTSRFRFDIVKGNGGEICAMAGMAASVRGIDGRALSSPQEAVLVLSRRLKTVAVATGQEDWFSDGTRCWRLQGGSEKIRSIIAGGCLLGTVMASCLAAGGGALESALAAALALDLAAEEAARCSVGPGTFQAALVDQLARLSSQGLACPDFDRRVKEL